MKDLKETIRITRTLNLLKNLLWSLVFTFIFALIIFFWIDGVAGQGFVLDILVPLILLLFCAFSGCLCWIETGKCIRDIVNPFKSDIVRKLGSPEKVIAVLDEIEHSIVYEDEKFVISRNYFCSSEDINFFPLVDITNVSKLVHRTNFANDYNVLIVTDKTGSQLRFTYSTTFYDKDHVDKVIPIIKNHCSIASANHALLQTEKINSEQAIEPLLHNDEFAKPVSSDAVATSSSQTSSQAYVTKDTASSPSNNTLSESKAPDIYCRYCGAKLPFDSLFCNKCGNKL